VKMAGSAEPAAACRHGCASWVTVAADGSSFLTSSHCAGTGYWVSGSAGMGERMLETGPLEMPWPVPVCGDLGIKVVDWHPWLFSNLMLEFLPGLF
jgi:hypothetical protein